MKNADVFDFDLKKIIKESRKKPEDERIKYLKSVIIDYQVEKGIFDTAYGAGLRMPKKLSQNEFIQTLESEIEKCKLSLYAEEGNIERARLHFEEALDTIREATPIIKENNKLTSKFIKELEAVVIKLDRRSSS